MKDNFNNNLNKLNPKQLINKLSHKNKIINKIYKEEIKISINNNNEKECQKNQTIKLNNRQN